MYVTKGSRVFSLSLSIIRFLQRFKLMIFKVISREKFRIFYTSKNILNNLLHKFDLNEKILAVHCWPGFEQQNCEAIMNADRESFVIAVHGIM